MPERLHRELERRASESTASRRKRGLRKITDRQAYVYGTMRAIEKARRSS